MLVGHNRATVPNTTTLMLSPRGECLSSQASEHPPAALRAGAVVFDLFKVWRMDSGEYEDTAGCVTTAWETRCRQDCKAFQRRPVLMNSNVGSAAEALELSRCVCTVTGACCALCLEQLQHQPCTPSSLANQLLHHASPLAPKALQLTACSSASQASLLSAAPCLWQQASWLWDSLLCWLHFCLSMAVT